MAKSRAPRRSRKPAAPAGACTIRMYCHGLGDCFLLTFPPADGNRPVRILIDCGVLQRTPGEAPKLRQVVENLRKDTDGEIDLLIVTHEHWDHIAGFSHAQDLFADFTFGRVWLSWAENPDDPDARAVKAELGKKRQKIQAALAGVRTRLGARANDPAAQDLLKDMETVEHLLDFFGPPDRPANARPAAAAAPKPKKGAAPPKMTLGQTMDWLRTQVRPGDWCSPGERRNLPGVDGVQVYVLGPPRSPARIRKMNPTGDQGYKHLRADRLTLFGALDWVGGMGEPASPFAEEYQLRTADARAEPFFRERYGFADDPLGDPGQSWRRIDDAWLDGLGRLALQLDTGVNNTSLALAFELPDGRTLIFPGDAQIGNWLSWDDVSFPTPAGQPSPVTARNLLNRAVFYKVGHHGSHNATRKVGGLEEMTGGDLVAMIPTDEAFAKTQSPPHGWKMPFAILYDALKTRTHSRILRADRGKDDLDNPQDSDLPQSAWKAFSGRVDFAKELLKRDPAENRPADQPLYVEYTIPR